MDGGGKKPDSGAAPNTAGGAQGEKVKNIQVLLEVFGKLEKGEEDPDSKAMIQSMADTAKKYLDKLQGNDKKGPAGAPATGEAGSGGMGTGAGAGGPEAGAAQPPAGVGAPGGMA